MADRGSSQIYRGRKYQSSTEKNDCSMDVDATQSFHLLDEDEKDDEELYIL